MSLTPEQSRAWISRTAMAYRAGMLSPSLKLQIDARAAEMGKVFPWGFINRTVKNKVELVEMARRGEPKPIAPHPLGEPLKRYTNKSLNVYDKAFDEEIRRIAPSWFPPPKQRPSIPKLDPSIERELVKMARAGAQRPDSFHPLGAALKRSTTKRSTMYNEKLTKVLLKFAPCWFAGTDEENKQRLLMLGRSQANRPSASRHPLGRVLRYYTLQSSERYDPVFDEEIRRIAPHWFEEKKNDPYI